MEPLYEITDDVKRDVLAATDLVALVGAVTSLKKLGSSWKGLCPFHGEKTPSFHVHPDKGFYYCFGCGAKGDAITFVRETERMEFPEAVAYLARRAGVTLPQRRTGTRADRARESRAAEALVAAAQFFKQELGRHGAALALVEKRGLSLAEAGRLGIGAAPDSWDALLRSLSGSFAEDVLLEAGLLQKNPETGRVYDRFRNRLTIEIRDSRGEVLGFGARALGDDHPKYLNSPETPRFSKGRLLYGLDRAREAIRKTDTVVLVEGYFDQIALERAGLANGVASMGTALTPQQAEALTRQAATVVVAYDGDPPGQAASRKAFALLLEKGASVRHLVLPGGHDPDSYLAERGADALREAVGAARPVLESLAGDVPPQGADPAERAARIRDAAEILKHAPDRVLRYELLASLARATGVPLETLGVRESGRRDGAPAGGARASAPGAPTEEVPEGEFRVMGLLLAGWPETAALVRQVPFGELLSHEHALALLEGLKKLDPERGTLDFSEFASHLDVGAGVLAARLLLEESPEEARPGDRPRLERLRKLLLQLRIRRLEERGASLSRQIAASESASGPSRAAEVGELLEERQRLTSEVLKLQRELRRPDEPG